MELAEKLHIEPGITAVIGSGGKTTLLARLAEELQGTVVLATSTRILPFPGISTASCPPLPGRVSCVGEPVDGGKLAAPTCGFEILSAAADHVVVEADGSRGLPLKAHAPWEPVIPEGSAQTILVVGASGFGRPVGSAVHRPEIFCALAGCSADDAATPELVARVVILVRENAAVMTAMVEAKRLNNLEPFAVHIDIGRHGEFDRIDMVVSVTAQEERFAVEQNAIAVEFNFARAVGRFESVDSLRTDQRRSYSIKVG